MPLEKIIVKLFLLLMIANFTANAQESTMSTGGNIAGTGGSASYSIGQINYTYQSSTFGSVNQGVQQAYEIFPVGIIKEENFMAKVFPNPTSDMIELHLSYSSLENKSYILYDSKGKLISSNAIKNTKTYISFDGSPIGAYFLEVITDGTSKEKFKIIKH